MRRISWAVVAVLMSAAGFAQVLSPLEISDPGARALQQRYSGALQAVARELEGRKYPYPFYFSRLLDIDESKQRDQDQRSIRFDRFDGQTVLEITGNYYAAYSAKTMDGNARARHTFFDVMLPLMKAMAPQFPQDQDFAAFAVEISHHVRGEVMGLWTENAENVALVLPRAAARKLATATTVEQQQAALLDGKMFLNGEPMLLWLSDDAPPAGWNERAQERKYAKRVEIASTAPPPVAPEPSVASNLIRPAAMPVRLIAPDTLQKLQSTHDEVLARMIKELSPQAHFVSYAPPSFIAFHQGAYLQLAMTTELAGQPAITRYSAAALAWDDQVSHLLRPVLAFFQDDASFDGIDFSTTVKGAGIATPVSVEFFVPFSVMRCYAQYDCTGQQVVDSGIVLINGERAGLELQKAEKER